MVAAFWRREITLRALRVRVEQLPPGGPTYRAINGHYWTDTENLLADLIDTTASYGAGQIRVTGGKVRKPRPVRRPGQKRPNQFGDTTGQDPELVLAYLQSLQPRQRQQKGA